MDSERGLFAVGVVIVFCKVVKSSMTNYNRLKLRT